MIFLLFALVGYYQATFLPDACSMLKSGAHRKSFNLDNRASIPLPALELDARSKATLDKLNDDDFVL